MLGCDYLDTLEKHENAAAVKSRRWWWSLGVVCWIHNSSEPEIWSASAYSFFFFFCCCCYQRSGFSGDNRGYIAAAQRLLLSFHVSFSYTRVCVSDATNDFLLVHTILRPSLIIRSTFCSNWRLWCSAQHAVHLVVCSYILLDGRLVGLFSWHSTNHFNCEIAHIVCQLLPVSQTYRPNR